MEYIEDEVLGPELPDVSSEQLEVQFQQFQSTVGELAFPEWAQLVLGSLFGEQVMVARVALFAPRSPLANRQWRR